RALGGISANLTQTLPPPISRSLALLSASAISTASSVRFSDSVSMTLPVKASHSFAAAGSVSKELRLMGRSLTPVASKDGRESCPRAGADLPGDRERDRHSPIWGPARQRPLHCGR